MICHLKRYSMIRTDKPMRAINYIIDFTSIMIIYIIISAYLPQQFIEVCYFIFYFLYYFLFEFLVGRTPGKFVTKTKVVNINGEKPGIKNILIRTVSRLIYLDLMSFLLGSVGMHDKFSKTYVANVNRQLSPPGILETL